ncbi:hypothetical protein Dimus_037744 [Dionaea muscipula]
MCFIYFELMASASSAWPTTLLEVCLSLSLSTHPSPFPCSFCACHVAFQMQTVDISSIMDCGFRVSFHPLFLIETLDTALLSSRRSNKWDGYLIRRTGNRRLYGNLEIVQSLLS